MVIPFSFQKGNKASGCEDAPPISKELFSVVCDGLGGAGSTKYEVVENGELIQRTSGYLGSRIVCDKVGWCFDELFKRYNLEYLKKIFFNEEIRRAQAGELAGGIKNKIIDSFKENGKKMMIEPLKGKTMKTFPTTLASLMYLNDGDKTVLLEIWAGDSRIYLLTPDKGLRLLSMDDAKSAYEEMNSSSEMTNCISWGNDFKIHYAVYEFKGPAIVFCCSDGCFDYMPSPLNFEWLLLHTIEKFMPEGSERIDGNVFATAICDTIYKEIYDDTTMAGNIIGINSYDELKGLFKPRMESFEPMAKDMNNYIKESKAIVEKKDSSNKTRRIYEPKIENAIKEAFYTALFSENGQNNRMLTLIKQLPVYRSYTYGLSEIDKRNEENYNLDIRIPKDERTKLEEICRDLLLSDFIRKKIVEGKNGGNEDSDEISSRSGMGFVDKFKSFWTKPGLPNNEGSLEEAICYLYSFIEMYKHPCFSNACRTLPGFTMTTSEFPSDLQAFERVIKLLNSNKPMLGEVWTQSYLSTDKYKAARCNYVNSHEFEKYFVDAKLDPMADSFISSVSREKIKELNDKVRKIDQINKKYEMIRDGEKRDMIDQLWNKNRESIVGAVMALDNDSILGIISDNSYITNEQIEEFLRIKDKIDNIDDEVKDARKKVDDIWKKYKVDYQLFMDSYEKGEC